MNVHFANFGYEELVSKAAKDKLKKQLKTTLDNDKDIKMQLEEKTEELLEKYFKKHNGKDLFLNYKVENYDIHINLEIKDKVKEKSKRYIKNENQEKNFVESDPRVTNDMVKKYKIAKQKFGEQLPNPKEILNEKSKHVKKYVEYVGMIIQNSQSEGQMMTMLDNEYSHYINSVTGFDYKAIINSFKQNLNKLQNEEEINKGPIFEKLDEIAEDEDEDEDENKEINSDDEANLINNDLDNSSA